MQSGNGIDLAAVYQLLTEVATTVRGHSERFDQIDRRFEQVYRKFEEVDRKLVEMTADISGLRDAVTHYHATVLGHGVWISELNERMRRIERHLKLEPTASG
jgi:hypothetical protein